VLEPIIVDHLIAYQAISLDFVLYSWLSRFLVRIKRRTNDYMASGSVALISWLLLKYLKYL